MEGGRSSPGAGPSAAPRFYHPELDGLRLVAFLLVFVFHAYPGRPRSWEWLGAAGPAVAAFVESGAYGVSLFFVLSAYLLVSLLDRERALEGGIGIRAFLVRRTLRIWPLYFAFLGGAALLRAGGILPRAPDGAVGPSFAFFAGNWALAAGGTADPILTHLWSVCVEEQFYIVLPFLLAVVPRARWPAAFVALALAGLAMRAELARRGLGYPATWYNGLVHLDAFAVGGLLACSGTTRGPVASGTGRWLLGAGGIAAGAAVAGLAPLASKEGSWAAVIAYPAVALACGAVLLAALGAGGSWLAAAPVRRLGRITYGLYVYHCLFLLLLRTEFRYGGPAWELAGRPALALGLTVATAAASYAWIERPFLAWKVRFSRVASGPA